MIIIFMGNLLWLLMLVRWSSEYKEENSIMDVKINLYLQHAGPVFEQSRFCCAPAPFLFCLSTFPLVSRSSIQSLNFYVALRSLSLSTHRLLIRVLNLLQRTVFSVTFFSGQQKCASAQWWNDHQGFSLFHKWKSMSIILSECVMDARDGRGATR
jgi:hypothetical protein